MNKRYVVALAIIGVLSSASCDDPPPQEDAGAPDSGAADAFVAECTTDAMCDDGLFCTGTEACEAGRCVSRGAVDCDDGVACTADECDEAAGMCTNTPPDVDEDGQADASCLGLDGVPLGPDCDDNDANRFAGNIERCDADNVDEDCDPSTFGIVDADADGFPAARCCNEDAAGELLCGTDCDDTRSAVQPDSPEVCNGLDDDCNGNVDEGVSIDGFVDEDRDGFGGPTPRTACAGAVGFAVEGGDCDDDDPTRRPGQLELCDGRDNDCDPETDEFTGPITWYRDADQDLYGSAASGTVEDCADRRPEYSILDTDCDDTRAGVNPAQGELCNGIDDDCNGLADFEIGVNDYEDDDGDSSVDLACGPPLGEDCDDADATTGAGSAEICDGRDNDCDGNVDEGATGALWYLDADGDGWGSELTGAMISCEPIVGRVARAGDCDDGTASVSPDAAEVCDGLDNDCNGSPDDGAAFSSCALDNASSVCFSGACRIDVCVDGFDDCNGDPSDGCEVSTGGLTSCGCAGIDCSLLPNVSSSVTCERPGPGLGYGCQIDRANGCNSNFGDCDGSPLTGCETPTDRSTLHCGGCNDACPNPPGATAICLDGGCLGVCLPGFLDCESGTPGCETNVRTLANCGGCGIDCEGPLPPGAASATCAFGAAGSFCQVASCTNSGFEDCNGNFTDGCETDTSVHPAHCGSCNSTCFGDGMECVGGDCVCESDRANCDANPDCETDILNDPGNCGGCMGAGGTVCMPFQICQNGTCQCPPGNDDCNGSSADGCEANLNSPQTCGDCSTQCGSGQGCQNGVCVGCGVGTRFQDCDTNGGCDTDTDNDPSHCGQCNMACGPGEICSGGSCSCEPGLADCNGMAFDGCEVDTRFDSDNCNGCDGAGGVPCDGGDFCSNGVCMGCPGGQDDCNRRGDDGCEVTLGTNSDCGGCGDICGIDQPCNGTFCQCPAGQLDCDGDPGNGCEAFEFEPANCLGCGPGDVCAPDEWCAMAGGCTMCTAPFTADCNFDGIDGCETDTRSNDNSCGGCNQPCGSGEECSEGVCCTEGTGACGGDSLCNDDLMDDEANCGECGHSCGPGGTCTNGTCDVVVDVKVGGTFSCALHSGGGVSCWGQNGGGQLGNGGAPGPFGAVILPDIATQIALGNDHACAITAANEVYCWGLNNSEGRIGNNTTGNIVLTPVHVSGGFGPAIDIAAGENHTCAIEGISTHGFNAGNVWCWGRDIEGQLGTAGAAANSAIPVMATDSGGFDNFDRITAGGDFTCGSINGQLSCWGGDGQGQAGNGLGNSNQSPTDMINVGTGIDQLVAGHSFACVRDFSQNLFCWGANGQGQIEPAGSASYDAPQLVRNNVFWIGGGSNHRNWVQASNTVRGYGTNNVGQLGDGTTTTPSSPVPVGPAGTFQMLAGGPLSSHSCGIDFQQEIYCWGENNNGRAVPGLGAAVLDPAPVIFP